MSLSTLLLTLVPLAWLLPNHYFPWPSAWQDGLAMLLLFGAALLARKAVVLPALWAGAAALAMGSAALQWATGLIQYGGDAVLVLLYVGALLVSIALGSTLVRASGHDDTTTAAEAVALGCLLAALVSVGIGFMQWSGSHWLGIWAADLPPDGRPFANVAQPNHLSTLAFIGLCALAFLREAGRIGATGFWTGALWLVAGMVSTGSRTGWVQAGAWLLLALVMQARVRPQVRAAHVALLTALYAAATWLWPMVNQATQLAGGRAVTHQIEGGARLPLWRALIDAVWREPWTGYGWQQVPAAQQAVALDHPPVMRYFEHSHNIVLDLLLWAGVPIASLIVLAVAAALVWQARVLRDARALWMFTAVVGVLLHGMLELPLEYAYFLVPMGLAIGVTHALSPAGPQWRVNPWLLRAAGLVGLAVLAIVALDYVEAEQNHRTLRFESARIGTTRIESSAPDLRVLTQLRAYLEFARTEARPDMKPEQVEWMRQVSQRHGYAPVLLRYALAAGLNGQPAQARLTLARLCSIHLPPRCTEAREAWVALQARYPVLLEVPPP